MRTAVSSVLAVAATLAAAVFANGCSAEAGCKPGNEKIDGECRLLCTKQDDCPNTFSCTGGSSKSYCMPNPAGIGTGTGEYGSACNATLKLISDHPDCAPGFQCFGKSPTDADAYCTKYVCATDGDCPGGFYCATVNEAPNAATYERSVNKTTTVCAKRSTFCSPCSSDVDCATRGYSGPALRCVADGKGQKFCTTECATDANCALDASCTDVAGTKFCTPTFGSCTGTGALCDRCESDANCKDDSICYEQEYTKEKSCTAKPDANGKCGENNAAPAGAPWSVGCSSSSPLKPMTPSETCSRVCLGLRKFDEIWYLGCYAKSPAAKN